MSEEDGTATNHRLFRGLKVASILLGCIVAMILLTAFCITLVYGVAYSFTADNTVSGATSSGVIESADFTEDDQFKVKFDGEVREGGPSTVSVLSPDGEQMYKEQVVPGVETLRLPDERSLLSLGAADPGEYDVVAVHGNKVHGEATVSLERRSLLPPIPLGRLWTYSVLIGTVFTVTVIAGMFMFDPALKEE